VCPHAKVGVEIDAEVTHNGRWANEVGTDPQLSARQLMLSSSGGTSEQISFVGVEL